MAEPAPTTAPTGAPEASDRAGTASQGYAGDVSPAEAWALLERDPGAVLVDVRTDAEWTYVGLPDLTGLGKETLCVSWQVFPAMGLNPGFAAELAASGVGRDQPLLLICRSGVRSRDAAIALTGAGYRRCYNVADGFEGPCDGARHRGSAAGWKASGLPWVQF